MAPMMVMTSATTAAKIGRSMKKRLILMGFAFPAGGAAPRPASFLRLRDRLCGRPRGQGRRLALGADLAAGAGALQAPNDHPLRGRDALAHHAQPLVERAEPDVAARHGAIVDDDID